MTSRLTNAEAARTAQDCLRQLIDAHNEWLCVRGFARTSIQLRKSECEFSIAHGRLIFTFPGERGGREVWRVTAWQWADGKLLLEVARRMGAERARLELIPRASHQAIIEAIGTARRRACQHLAALACAHWRGARIESAHLSAGARRSQPGKYARIILRRFNRERIAVTGIVVDSETHDLDAFLSSALIWFTRATERVQRPPRIEKLCIIVGQKYIEALAQQAVLLRDGLRRVIEIYQLDEAQSTLTPVRLPQLDELLNERPKKFRLPVKLMISEGASSIMELAPEAIDAIASRRGETLRFHGLAFARVRRVMNREKIWFGIEGSRRRLLEESTLEEFQKLIEELKKHRRADVPDQHHVLYKLAPEAWLESILRRDISQLDPGLRLAPLYAQFRSSHTRGGSSSARPIDLLALRRDGRLVVIELKVSEDREHVLQAADYWRRICAHHRVGQISSARLFGEAEISSDPPLVYLVAPMMSFHRQFSTLARAITPAIEMYRFDINEDWRARVRVARRERIV